MGTYYAITIVGRPAGVEPERLHEVAKGELERVEGLMSAYRGDSDVGRINAAEHGEWVGVSRETAGLVELAMRIGRLSGGAYDITAGGLVRLWGFGPGGGAGEAPRAERVEEARRHVGPELLDVRMEPPGVRKRDPLARVDLASVAKGFGVDCAAEALERMGVEDYCVEVGGEVRVRGLSARGAAWQVAIESPVTSGRTVHRVVGLKDRAMATSGDYRIFREEGGVRYPHVIDPRTGYPIRNGVASVSVVDASCAVADAWATALMVMGVEEGVELAGREGVAALFLVRTDGGIEERGTARLQAACGFDS